VSVPLFQSSSSPIHLTCLASPASSRTVHCLPDPDPRLHSLNSCLLDVRVHALVYLACSWSIRTPTFHPAFSPRLSSLLTIPLLPSLASYLIFPPTMPPPRPSSSILTSLSVVALFLHLCA
jgi:hypothetical protein